MSSSVTHTHHAVEVEMIHRSLRGLLAVVAALGAVMFLVAAGTLLAAVGFASDGPGPGAAYLAANLLISLAAAVVGGALVVRLAGERPLLHAVVLACLMALLSLSGGPEPGGAQPAWYPAVVLGLGLVGVASGAIWMHRMHRRRRAPVRALSRRSPGG